MPKHEGGSHLLLNLVKLARARPPARLCLTLVQVQVVGATQGRTLESTWTWEEGRRGKMDRSEGKEEACGEDREKGASGTGTSVNIGNYMQSLVLLSLGN